MGIWKWIVESVSSPSPSGNERADGKLTSNGGGVAVLDHPSAREGDLQDRWWSPEGAELTEQIETQRPQMPPEIRALENLLVSHFDGHDLSLPSLPQAAERVLGMLSRSDCDPGAVASVISEDQVLAGGILRITNSPLYRAQDKITSLKAAVTRLGVKMIRTIMMQHALRAATSHRKGSDNELAEIVWRRSLASAGIIRGLSRFTSADEEEASLAGLLHDVGNVIVLRVVMSQEALTHDKIDVEMFEYLCYECHQEFGELIADAWKLPDELKALILDHHTYPSPDDPQRTIRLLLQLTDMINPMLGYSLHVSYNLPESRVVRDLGLTQNDAFFRFLDELPSQIEETALSF